MSYIYFFLVALFGLSSCQSECSLDFVCDPSPESDIHTYQSHAGSVGQCKAGCKFVHDNGEGTSAPECNFFTFRANMPDQSNNCHYLTECRRLTSPPPGMTSGVANCDDSTFFCDSLGEIPEYDDKRAYWSCDSGHPYGGSKVNQGVHCSVGCPSFKLEDGTPVEQVSSSCKWNDDSKQSEWSAAVPADVMTSTGAIITTPALVPLPECGCGDLILEGEIKDEEGKVFQCTLGKPTVNADGNTVITDDDECLLLCDGAFVFDLFCSAGVWSINLKEASEIFCYNGGDGGEGSNKPLSTWFPPPSTDPTLEPSTQKSTAPQS